MASKKKSGKTSTASISSIELAPLPKPDRSSEIQVAIRLSTENHARVHNDAAAAGCSSVAAYIRMRLGIPPQVRQ